MWPPYSYRLAVSINNFLYITKIIDHNHHYYHNHHVHRLQHRYRVSVPGSHTRVRQRHGQPRDEVSYVRLSISLMDIATLKTSLLRYFKVCHYLRNMVLVSLLNTNYSYRCLKICVSRHRTEVGTVSYCFTCKSV